MEGTRGGKGFKTSTSSMTALDSSATLLCCSSSARFRANLLRRIRSKPCAAKSEFCDSPHLDEYFKKSARGPA